MGSNVFDDCSLLTSINTPNSIISFGSYTFYKCSGLTNITIPNQISSISYGLFFRCSRLTSIAIPDNITSIGNGVFSGCIGLSSIIMKSTVPPTLEDSVFNGTNDYPIYSFWICFSILGCLEMVSIQFENLDNIYNLTHSPLVGAMGTN